MGGDSKVRDTAEVVKGIVEAVPVYQDVVQPAAKEIGVGLQTLAKTVHIALAPVSALVWGFEQFKEFISTTVTKKLENTPPEDIQPPQLNVAGPALEALRFAGPEEELRELYANLLAASMDKVTASRALPSFVEIIKQMTPDEAKLMRLFHQQETLPLIHLYRRLKDQSGVVEQMRNISNFGTKAGCSHPENLGIYLDNLCRLGLIEIPDDRFYTDEKLYEPLETAGFVRRWKADFREESKYEPYIKRALVRVTILGYTFMKTCVTDHNRLREELTPHSS